MIFLSFVLLLLVLNQMHPWLKLVLLNNYFYLLHIQNVSDLNKIHSIIFIACLVRSNSPLVKNFKLTTSQEDFEFKKLLFNTIVVLSRNPVMTEVCPVI